MVTCSYDSNAILVRLLKTRTRNELIEVVKSIYQYLVQRGYKLKHYIINNENLIKMKNYMKSENVIFN